MLYGNNDFRKKFHSYVDSFCAENEIIPVFAAMVGSISRGIEFTDSDYDTRILYLDNNNRDLNKILVPYEMEESSLRKRLDVNTACNKDGEMYEWIPFWELTSFFQFLKKPAFNGKISNGLYNVFEWTMFSPYVWDPYGLQPKLYELVNSIFNADYLIEYHKQIIMENFNNETDIVLKNYLQCIYSSLALDWISKKNHFYPMYIQSLMINLDPKLKEQIFSIIQYGRCESSNIVNKSQNLPYQYCHYHLKCLHIKEIDDYIKTMLDLKITYKKKTDEEIDIGLNKIYELIRSSINDNRIC